ncbi:SDR family NAD(P)-dependent oxidoreductase, partial [Streptomyces sp. NPDC059873]
MRVPGNPVALITGGTRGIGLGVARELGGRGHRVFICARTAQEVKLTVEELRAEGMEAEGAVADVRDRASVSALVAAVVAQFGPVN